MWMIQLVKKFMTKKGQAKRERSSERLSFLDNRENGGLPHFFAILVVLWAECCGGHNSFLNILKLRILTANRLG